METRTRPWRAAGLALATALSLGACGDGAPSAPSPGDAQELRSDHARITAPASSAADLAALVRGNTQFALDLHRAAARDGENVVFSPFSVSIALGMTWAGARTETEAQMARALHFDLPQSRLHAAFNALDQDLARRAARAATAESPRPFRFRVANALWGQRGYAFLPTFLDALAENYGAGMRITDFAADAPGARRAINAWVSDQTERRIPELLPEGIPSADTALVLTNAVYFNAGWLRTFPAGQTTLGPFARAAGGPVGVSFMNQVARLPYAAGDGWQAVELAYQGEFASMLVVVPAEGRFAEVERGLTADVLATVSRSLQDHIVTLALPRYSFRTKVMLADALGTMGMPLAFSAGAADFSGMDGTRRLYLRHVVHEGWIAVDEYGTEAAGATAVVAEPVSAPPPATLRADRPFLFVIRDRTTGTVLFLGRVMDPSRA